MGPEHKYYEQHKMNLVCSDRGVCGYKVSYSVKRPSSKRLKFGFQDQLSLNAGQKYCRMLQVEHSAILLTFIKLPIVIKIFVLSLFEWPLKTGFTAFLKKTEIWFLRQIIP